MSMKKHATNYKYLLIQEILNAFLSVVTNCNGIFETIPLVIGNAVNFFSQKYRVLLLEAIRLPIIRPHRFFSVLMNIYFHLFERESYTMNVIEIA